jgi:hypothetical protein
MFGDMPSDYCNHPHSMIKSIIYVDSKVYNVCECCHRILVNDYKHIEKLGQNRMKTDQNFSKIKDNLRKLF